MTKTQRAKGGQAKRINWKRLRLDARNLPVIVLGVGAILAYDVFAAGGIFQTNTETSPIFGFDVKLAWIETIGSILCGLLAFAGGLAASEMKADPRPEQQQRAFGARCLCVLLMVAPITYLGNAFAFQAQTAEWKEYYGSEAYKADLAQSQDDTIDSLARRDAAINLTRAIEPKVAKFDPFRWLWAAFLYLAVQMTAAVFYRAKPETEAQAKRRNDAIIAEQQRLTREAELKAEADERRAALAAAALDPERKTIFGLRFGQTRRTA